MHQPLLLCPFVAALLAAAAAGQAWNPAPPAGGPTNALAAVAAYHGGTNRTVMFVGAPSPATWLYDGTTWTAASPANSPPGRTGGAMALDSLRQRVVLFGGLDGTGQPLADTWEWNGSNWLQRTPAATPPARFGHCMAFDPFRRRTVVFGGNLGTSAQTRFTDTWEWDGNNWAQVNTANAPDGAEAGAMCFDVLRFVFVLIGGQRRGGAPDGRTWEYDGTDWTDRTAVVGTGPDVAGHAMVYDSGNRTAVLYGGADAIGRQAPNTWEYDGFRWRHVVAGTPFPRPGFVMAMDTVRQVVVLHGGLNPLSEWLRETWWYRSGVRVPGSFAVVGTGCPGSRGVPTNNIVATPRIGDTMWICLANLPPPYVCSFLIGFSNTHSILGPLPLSLAPAGAPGCFLRNSVETTVEARGTDGFALFPVAVPNLAFMAGITFYAQGFVLDPGVNPLGAVMSEAARGVIGH